MRSAAFVVCGFLTALPLAAQLATDLVPRERTISRTDEIRRDLADSRFRLGPIRIRPVFAIRDLGYDNNVFGAADGAQVGDWRSTVGAGANLILPMGRKLYLTGSVIPEYTYYQRLTDRRLFGGNYGGSAIALFNRLSVEAGGNIDKAIGPVSSELERSAPGRQTNQFVRSEIEVFRRLSFFGSAQRQEQRYELTASDVASGTTLDQLERNETVARGGVRYALRSYFDISAAVENGTTDFVSARTSDNSTHAVIAGIHYDRPRFFVNVSGGSRTGEARGSFSTFPRYSTTTGSYYAAYQLGVPLAVDAYGHRSVVYGLYAGNPYFLETRNGIGFTLPVGQRLGLRGFTEAGKNAYPIRSGGVLRTDDVTVVGGGIAYRLYRTTTLTIVASDTRYTSNIPDFNRSIFRVATVVSLRGEFFR